jgi:hypothetical protein
MASRRDTKTSESRSRQASIFLQWRWSRLPTVMPASGIIVTMPNASRAEFGGQPVLLSPRPGTPGEKVGWGEHNRTYAGVYRCDVTNYSDFPIFNLATAFKTEFFPVGRDQNNPNASARSSQAKHMTVRSSSINSIHKRPIHSTRTAIVICMFKLHCLKT